MKETDAPVALVVKVHEPGIVNHVRPCESDQFGPGVGQACDTLEIAGALGIHLREPS